MSDSITLQAAPRSVTGKKVKQLRRDGLTPIVLYGPSSEPINLQVPTRHLVETLDRSGTTGVIEVQIDGEDKPRRAIARSQQLHPTRLVPIHADLMEVKPEDRVTTIVPVRLGEKVPRQVQRTEARLALLIEQLEIQARPDDIPHELIVDCSKLRRIGQYVTIGEIDVDEDVKILADPDRAIARMAQLRRAMVIAEDLEEEEEEEELEEGELPEGEEDEETEGEGDEAPPPYME